MKKFAIRGMEPSTEGLTYIEWLKAASDVNLVDWKTLEYPSALHLTVTAGEEPVLMTTVHPILVVEALAPKPGLTPRQEAGALLKFFEGVRNLANAKGISELWFQCEDPTLEKFILGRGFVKSSPALYKMRLNTESDPLHTP